VLSQEKPIRFVVEKKNAYNGVCYEKQSLENWFLENPGKAPT
jgi:hypothetical protein